MGTTRMRQQWCPGRFSSPPQKRPGNEARSGGTVLGGDVLLRMRHTHKMATNTSGNAGRAPVSLFDSLAEFICSSGENLG